MRKMLLYGARKGKDDEIKLFRGRRGRHLCGKRLEVFACVRMVSAEASAQEMTALHHSIKKSTKSSSCVSPAACRASRMIRADSGWLRVAIKNHLNSELYKSTALVWPSSLSWSKAARKVDCWENPNQTNPNAYRYGTGKAQEHRRPHGKRAASRAGCGTPGSRYNLR